MHRKIEILQRETVFNRHIFKIDELELQHELYSGQMGQPIKRLILERGDSVAVLPHDPVTNTIMLCEQFRAPTIETGSGWLLELPAGMIDLSEAPSESARREMVEETGLEVADLRLISTVFLSPGGSSERIHIFYGRVDLRTNMQKFGGLAAEGEDILLVNLLFETALQQLQDGSIQDAKTVIAVQWLELAIQRGEVTLGVP